MNRHFIPNPENSDLELMEMQFIPQLETGQLSKLGLNDIPPGFVSFASLVGDVLRIGVKRASTASMGSEFDGKTVDELRQIAAVRGVKVGDNASKGQILELLRKK